MLRPKIIGNFFIDTVGQSLDRCKFVKCLKEALVFAGYDNSRYNSHSIRIGRTTDLAMAGISHEKIRIIGRWSSDAYMRYIRPSEVVLP